MNAPSDAQGQAFARDVRRIRETQGVTQQEIHQATKIPKHLLEQFEVDALFSHDTFNRVYLRSVARSVADHIGVDRKDMMDALEAALRGEYKGQLASGYLGEPPAMSTPPDPADRGVDDADAESTDATEPDDDTAQAPLSAPTTGDKADAAASEAQVTSATSPEEIDQEETDTAEKETGGKEATGKEATPRDDAAGRPNEDPSAGRPQVEETAPAASAGAPDVPPSSDRGAVRATEEKQPTPVRPRPVWPYVVGGAVVVAAIILLIFALQSDDAPEPTPPAPTEVAPVDTAAEATAPPLPDTPGEATDEAAAAPELGDTLTVEVVAAFDRVDPIRIRVDDDLRRPYWIEEGESRRFSAVDQIILENQLDAIELRLEGVPIPTDERDAEGRIVITRERAERLLSENPPGS